MLLKPISASEALYARAVDQIFFHDPNGMAQLLAIESYGTFEGKLRPRSDARGSREDWVKQYTSNLDDIMRDAAEAQALLVTESARAHSYIRGTENLSIWLLTFWLFWLLRFWLLTVYLRVFLTFSSGFVHF